MKQYDQEFLRRAMGGDAAAFETLYADLTPTALRDVRPLLFYHTDAAEDVVQDAWYNALTRFQTFEYESSFQTWFSNITRNAAYDYLRKQTAGKRDARRTHALSDIHDPVTRSPYDDPERYTMARFAHKHIGRAVVKLSDTLRDATLMDLSGAYSHDEIGVRLGVEATVIKVRVCRGRASLRKRLHAYSNFTI